MPDKVHEQTDKELKRLERQITKEYSQAAKEVEKKLTDYLEKFAKKDAEMQKKVASGQMSAEEYGKWRVGQMAMGERWKEMQKTLTEDLVNADKIAAGMINDSLPSAYALNFNYGTYEVEHGARINTSFTLYDHSTVENLLKKDPKIIPQARIDIPKDQRWNRQKLTSAITQGILQGEGIPKISNRLLNTVGTYYTVEDIKDSYKKTAKQIANEIAKRNRNAAIRNARTYTTAAENKGRIDSYDRAEQMGIKVKKKWMATLDDRTRVEHRHLDGQVRENDEPFETDGYEIMYPGDPDAEPEMIYNCRCTLVAEIEGIDYHDERNDSKLGDMTYEEWKHAKDKPGTEVKEEEYPWGTPKAAEPVQMEQPKMEIPEKVQEEIDKFENKFWNAKKENYMAIDKDGNIIYQSTGKERRATVPKYIDEQNEGGYSIHNHPAEAVFSPTDVLNYEEYGEHGFVSDNAGNEYILYNTNPVSKYKDVEKAVTNEEIAEILPFSTAYGKAFSEIEDTILKERREFAAELKETVEDSAERTRKLLEWMKEHNSNEMQIKWLEENAENYGFIFIRKRR